MYAIIDNQRILRLSYSLLLPVLCQVVITKRQVKYCSRLEIEYSSFAGIFFVKYLPISIWNFVVEINWNCGNKIDVAKPENI